MREQDNLHCGIQQLERHQWETEWQAVVKQASAEVPPGKALDSLEEFHVFVLANILRRPIIMYAVPKMRSVYGATLQRVNFHGVYLPLLWDPSTCKKDPLPLAFYGGHFSSLVVIEFPQQYRDGCIILPLMDFYGQQLPVRFMLPQEDPTALLMDYLDLIQIPDHGSPYIFPGGTKDIICAKLTIPQVPAYLKPLISGFIDACYDAFGHQQSPQQPNQFHTTAYGEMQHPHPDAGNGSTIGKVKCINNCGMFGDPVTGLCSQCYRKAQTAAQAQENVPTTLAYNPSMQHGTPPVQQGIPWEQQGSSQPKSAQGQMKCPHCPNPAHPNYLGMCERCYQRTAQRSGQVQPQQQRKEEVYETISNYQSRRPVTELSSPAVPPPVPPPRSNTGPGERTKCRVPGCDFFGTAESRYYCSKCFNENMEKILDEEVGLATSASPAPVPGKVQHPFTAPQFAGAYGQPQYQPQHYEVPVQARDPSSQLAEKCFNCQSFFGSQEYGGLCTGCFMKKTEYESSRVHNKPNPLNDPPAMGPPPMKMTTEPLYHRQQQPESQYSEIKLCAIMGCRNPANESGMCPACEIDQHPPQRPPKPVPRQRKPPDPSFDPQSREISTAPVGRNLVNQLGRMTLEGQGSSSNCFICMGTGIGSASDTFSVCPRHATMMQSMLPQTNEKSPTHNEFPKPKPRHPTSTGFVPFCTEAGPNYGQPLTSTDYSQPQPGTPLQAAYGQPSSSQHDMHNPVTSGAQGQQQLYTYATVNKRSGPQLSYAQSGQNNTNPTYSGYNGSQQLSTQPGYTPPQAPHATPYSPPYTGQQTQRGVYEEHSGYRHDPDVPKRKPQVQDDYNQQFPYEGGSGGHGSGYGTTGQAAGGYGQMAGAGGYGQTAGGYGQTTGGYEQAAGGYGQTTGGYEQTAGGYGQTAGGYGQTTGGYGQTAGGYEQTAGGYGQTAGGYGQTTGGYEQTAGGYGQTMGGYEQTAGGYEQTAGGYGQTTGGYEQAAGGYGQTAGGYGQTMGAGGYRQTAGGYGQTAGAGGYGQTAGAGGYGQTAGAGGYRQTVGAGEYRPTGQNMSTKPIQHHPHSPGVGATASPMPRTVGARGSGGEMGGARGGGDAQGASFDEQPPVKMLCRVAGCSFKAVPELNNFCPDCYEEHYGNPPPTAHQ